MFAACIFLVTRSVVPILMFVMPMCVGFGKSILISFAILKTRLFSLPWDPVLPFDPYRTWPLFCGSVELWLAISLNNV